MCGIAAVLSIDPLQRSQVQEMLEVIHHRGPDGDGIEVFNDGRVWLGHKRLSILDLSTNGSQPMERDQQVWLTYNGEIYNYKEIRSELELNGYSFTSQTDTEVILAAYQEWGTACVERFNGMWAFALVDIERGQLFISRDRFGIKPLYYWISPRGFVAFASEIKQFTKLPGWDAALNDQRAYDYLSWSLIDHTDETLFKGVRQLRGGELAVLSLHSNSMYKEEIPIHRWYTITPRAAPTQLGEAVEVFRELLMDSVMLRLRSDVPVGSCLSGGLDSSSIVCLIHDHFKMVKKETNQHTFSIASNYEQFDETVYIKEVAQHVGIDPCLLYPDHDQLFMLLDRIAWHQDEPFNSASIYAQWCVFEEASRQGVKVVLDGQGADEVIAGYHGFLGPHLTGLLRSFKWLQLLRDIQATKALHDYDAWFILKRMSNTFLPESLRQLLRKRAGKSSIHTDWINMERLQATPLDPFTAHGAKTSTVQGLSLAQLQSTNLPMLLHWEDRNSMAHSVESRLPFLDYRLVEFVIGLPDDWKLSEGVTKRVLREAMKGSLPESIRQRHNKMGFVTPEERWMTGEASESFRALLNQAIDKSSGIIREDIREKFERMRTGKEPYSSVIWKVISFGQWMEAFRIRT